MVASRTLGETGTPTSAIIGLVILYPDRWEAQGLTHKIFADYKGNIYRGELDESLINHENVIRVSGNYGDCIRCLDPSPTAWMTASGAEKVVTNRDASAGWKGFWMFQESGHCWQFGDSTQKLLFHMRGQCRAVTA